ERVTEASGPLPAASVTAAAAVDAAKNGLEFRPREDGKTWSLVRRERRLVGGATPGAEEGPEVAEMEALLNLFPGQRRYDLVVAPGHHPALPSGELRVTPRSTAQAYRYLANGVEVPPAHVTAGLVCPAAGADGREATGGLFVVHTAAGHRPPANAYLAVRYRG